MLKQIIPKNKTRLSELIREQTDLGHFQIQKIISGKSVKINGQRVNQDVVLKGDETVYIYIKDREKDKIDIVYQDKNVIAVNKPAGMEVTGEDSLAEKLELQHEDMKFFPVHRLDRNTTGLVIFALTPQAEAELNKAFKEKWVDKFYNAVVVGRPNVSQAQLKAFLFKDAKKSLAIVSKTAKLGYVPIETHYRVLKQSGGSLPARSQAYYGQNASNQGASSKRKAACAWRRQIRNKSDKQKVQAKQTNAGVREIAVFFSQKFSAVLSEQASDKARRRFAGSAQRLKEN